mgnify:FL=1
MPVLKNPNIVFVFADQMRAQATGYEGDPNVQTPCLDNLAGESLNFTNAISNCPVCTPYRACLLTGQYPLTHGLFMNDLCLPDNGHSLGQELRRGGYATGWIGKWHLDGHGRRNPVPADRRQGFDFWKALECTHNYEHSQYYDGDDPTPRFWDGYDAYSQTDEAVRFIRSRATSDRPFALFLSFGSPHDPYDTAPDDLRELYSEADLVLRDNVPPHRERRARKQLTGYYAHITAIDRCMARLNRVLDETGCRENTILVFTSDHGDMLESHWHVNDGQRGVRKQVPYDESVRVPLLVRYPERYGTEGRKVPEPVATPDLMPTLLAMCGLPSPDTVEGVDLTPVIDGEAAPGREGVLIAGYHPFSDWRVQRGGRPYRGIRTRRCTFVRDRNGPWLLFDNDADPFQQTNLVNTSSAAAMQERLDSELHRILSAQHDGFEAPEDLRERWGYQVDDLGQIPF